MSNDINYRSNSLSRDIYERQMSRSKILDGRTRPIVGGTSSLHLK